MELAFLVRDKNSPQDCFCATIGGENLAKGIEGKPLDEAAAVADRLKDTAVSSALSFGLLNVPGTVNNIIGAKHEQGKLQAQSPITQDKAIQGAPQAPQSPIAQDVALQQHTPEMEKIINDYQKSVDEGIIKYVDDVRNSRISAKTLYEIGKMSARAAKEVAPLIGFNATDYKVTLNPAMVAHIDKRHGENGQQDKSMADINDLARIKYVLANYDSVIKDPTTSKAFKNSDGKSASKLVYQKRVDGTYYVVEATPDTKARTLQIVTAYKTKATPQASLTNVVESTSKNAPVDVAFNDNIPQPISDVNGDIVGANENIYRAPQWDERQRIDENNGTVYSAQSAGLHNRAEQDKIVELSAKLSVPIRFMNDTNANINGKYENGTI